MASQWPNINLLGGNARQVSRFRDRDYTPKWAVLLSISASAPRKITFSPGDEVRELARRGGANTSLDTLQAMEHAIEIAGAEYGWLTEEQYGKLKNT